MPLLSGELEWLEVSFLMKLYCKRDLNDILLLASLNSARDVGGRIFVVAIYGSEGDDTT